MKKCTICKLDKPSYDYGKDSSKKSGLSSHCKSCNRLKCKKWFSLNKDKLRAYQIKTRYGISDNEYISLLESQENLCKICGSPSSGVKLSVDHCHKTGKIRGLLCHKCNRGLGLFSDNTELLKKAIEYLGI